MSDAKEQPDPRPCSRRKFLQRGSAAAFSTAGGLSVARMAHAGGNDLIRLAFIGCGGRGGGAVTQALSTAGPVKLVAMADVFADRIEDSLKYLTKIDSIRDRIDVPPERRFVGFDAYQKALDCGVDMVILTTPPHFRPIHYAAAVKAGKHVYMEKPVAVDAPGFRTVEEANMLAKKKGLKVAVGFQRRHEIDCRDVVRQIGDGQIGPVRLIRTYYLMSGPSAAPFASRARPRWNTNCGTGHISPGCRAIISWSSRCMRWTWPTGSPTPALAGPGSRRQAGPGGQGHRPDFRPRRGRVRISRQLPLYRLLPDKVPVATALGQHVQGTKGELGIGRGSGSRSWARSPPKSNPYQLQHDRLFAAIRARRALFRGRLRGQQRHVGDHGPHGPVLRQDNHLGAGDPMRVSLAPARYALDADPPVLPSADGSYPVPMPGITQPW